MEEYNQKMMWSTLPERKTTHSVRNINTPFTT